MRRGAASRGPCTGSPTRATLPRQQTRVGDRAGGAGVSLVMGPCIPILDAVPAATLRLARLAPCHRRPPARLWPSTMSTRLPSYQFTAIARRWGAFPGGVPRRGSVLTPNRRRDRHQAARFVQPLASASSKIGCPRTNALSCPLLVRIASPDESTFVSRSDRQSSDETSGRTKGLSSGQTLAPKIQLGTLLTVLLPVLQFLY